MARVLPSAVPPQMYRHFALVTVLLTAGVAMFADGENREAAAAQVAQREASPPPPRQTVLEPPKPATARRPARRDDRFARGVGFEGQDLAFGAPMDRALGSLLPRTTQVAPDVAQTAGYSDTYLASLSAEERERLLKGLAQEGMLTPGERERRNASLMAASAARSGGSAGDY